MDHVDDIKQELQILAELLDDVIFSGNFTEQQTNLMISMAVEKLRLLGANND